MQLPAFAQGFDDGSLASPFSPLSVDDAFRPSKPGASFVSTPSSSTVNGIVDDDGASRRSRWFAIQMM
jgi:hypothetical protein